MKSWRKPVIALLRAALRVGQLRTELTVDQMEDLLTHFAKCRWSVKVQLFENKWHFLQYAGRYVGDLPLRSVASPASSANEMIRVSLLRGSLYAGDFRSAFHPLWEKMTMTNDERMQRAPNLIATIRRELRSRIRESLRR